VIGMSRDLVEPTDPFGVARCDEGRPCSGGEREYDGTAAQVTLHCLTGCTLGEVLGMVIGTSLGLHDAATVALSIALAADTAPSR
jgi:hypothetical protein